MTKNTRDSNRNAVDPLSPVPLLDQLDIQLKVMNDKIEDVLNLLNLYLEFEEVVRSFILEDNPSLEKQLEAIAECKADIETENITDDLGKLAENAIYLMEQLKTENH